MLTHLADHIANLIRHLPELLASPLVGFALQALGQWWGNG